MPLKMTDIATLTAAELKRQLANGKAESVKEMKSLAAGLIADSLGSGSNGFKSLSDKILADVLQRIPQSSVFTESRGNEHNPEKGFMGMSQSSIKSLAERVRFAVSSDGQRDRFFGGKDAKALSVGIGSSGGYTLPEEFVAEVQRKLVHNSVMLNLCRTWSGVDMIGKMPRETGTVTVTYTPELITYNDTQFALGQLTWALAKRTAITQLPEELWKFSGIDVLNLLATMFAEQFQKTEDLYYLLGSGSGQPMGALTNTSGMNALSIKGSHLAWQDLNAAKAAIKSQYRLEKASCAWMMNNDTLNIIADLADNQNRPIFIDRGPAGIAGPDLPAQTIGFIAGYPVLENPYIPGPVTENPAGTSTTSQIMFGNWERGYAVFKGSSMETKTSDQAGTAFATGSLFTKATDYNDGKPNIPEALAILSGVIV